MSDLVDLHLHSIYSDGVLTPAELIAEAARINLRAVSIADHDNLDGIPEALEAGAALNIEVVPAVELSVVWCELEDLHLLGYAFDHCDKDLNKALADLRNFRAGRSAKILSRVNERLEDQGRTPLTIETIFRRAEGTIGRPHIGQALIAAGYVRDMDQAFAEYLIPCNVPKRYFPAREAIDLIHAAGGCTVLAHPALIRAEKGRLLELLERLKSFGLDGLEAYSGGADNQQIDQWISRARQMDLIVTGGSDFHQTQSGGVAIGIGRGNLKVPYHCVTEIRRAAQNYR